MKGEFKIKVGRSIYTYTNFDDIPKEIGAVDIYDDVEDSLFLKFFS